MRIRGYRIIAGTVLSASTLAAPAVPPHFFEILIFSRLPLDAPASQLVWQWLCIATFWTGGLLVGRARSKAAPAPDAKRDATIRQLSEAASSFAAANAQWQEQFGRLAEERDELAARCAELTAERDSLCNQLGQARAALARGPAFPRKFIALLKHQVFVKSVKVGLHPDRAKSEVERKQREAMTKLFLEFLDYVEAGDDFSKAG
jgi:hypothetical protein